ncbi:MAG: PIG-L family deacetylase [Desulfobacterales bacterium]|nr:PIG-L family deacetylase [Desulfobacterales bacterium]
MRKMNILAIGAHPDDIEFGCGGALTKFAAKGHAVFLLVMTQGGMGAPPDVRAKEQSDAKSLLGAQQLFWGGYEDTYLVSDKDMICKIEAVIKEVEPAFIFCHYPDDTHQDHRHLSQTTVSATRYVKNVLFYEGPTTQNFSPHVFIDISDTLEQKVAALKAHRSQIKKTNIEDLSIAELAYSSANFRGIQGRVRYAEAFHSLRLFINI